LITRTVWRHAALNLGVMTLLFLVFNLITILIVRREQEDLLDERLLNEMRRISGMFSIEDSILHIENACGLQEPALLNLSRDAFFLQVYTLKGKILLQSKTVTEFGQIPLQIFIRQRVSFFENLNVSGSSMRAAYRELNNVKGNLEAIIQVAAFQSGYEQLTNRLVLFNLISFPLVFIVLASVSILLAKRSYAPINKIIGLAENISAANLSARLTYKASASDELGRLRDTLNRLFTRLENQIRQISQFTDNASHQLMSPLTILKTELEYHLKKNQTDNPVFETCMILKEQTDRMIHIVKTMLILAREGADGVDSRSVFNLSRVVDDLQTMFAAQNVKYETDNNLLLRGNKDYFSMAIQNLICNSIKYSEPNSEIWLKAKHTDGSIRIAVEDFGIGIPQDERQKIFERFYRGKNINTEQTQGYGLGLSLTQSVIQAMGGMISVEDNEPSGARFIIWLKPLQIS
jgi:signal transduction histidine kinase